jgi:hypothetical protein
MDEPPYARRGIINSGNSCYLSSVLQLLFCIRGFAESLGRIMEHGNDEKMQTVAVEMMSFFSRLSRPVRPDDPEERELLEVPDSLRGAILDVIGNNAGYMPIGEQADPAEVLIPLLDRVAADYAVPAHVRDSFCLAENMIRMCARNDGPGTTTELTISRYSVLPTVKPIDKDPITERNQRHTIWVYAISRANKLKQGDNVLIRKTKRKATVIDSVEDTSGTVTFYNLRAGRSILKARPAELALEEHVRDPGPSESTTVQRIIELEAEPHPMDGVSETCKDGTFLMWDLFTVEKESTHIVIPTPRIASIDQTGRYVTKAVVDPGEVRLWLTDGSGMVSYEPIGAVFFIERYSHYVFARISDGVVTRIYDDSSVAETEAAIRKYNLDPSTCSVMLLYQRTGIDRTVKLDRSTWGLIAETDNRKRDDEMRLAAAQSAARAARPARPASPERAARPTAAKSKRAERAVRPARPASPQRAARPTAAKSKRAARPAPVSRKRHMSVEEDDDNLAMQQGILADSNTIKRAAEAAEAAEAERAKRAALERHDEFHREIMRDCERNERMLEEQLQIAESEMAAVLELGDKKLVARLPEIEQRIDVAKVELHNARQLKADYEEDARLARLELEREIVAFGHATKRSPRSPRSQRRNRLTFGAIVRSATAGVTAW